MVDDEIKHGIENIEEELKLIKKEGIVNSMNRNDISYRKTLDKFRKLIYSKLLDIDLRLEIEDEILDTLLVLDRDKKSPVNLDAQIAVLISENRRFTLDFFKKIEQIFLENELTDSISIKLNFGEDVVMLSNDNKPNISHLIDMSDSPEVITDKNGKIVGYIDPLDNK